MNDIEAKALDILIDFCDDEPLRETARKGLADLRALADLFPELARIAEIFESRGYGPNDTEEFYCPQCGAHDKSYISIPHEKHCTLIKTLTKVRKLTDAPPADLPTIHEVKGILKGPSTDHE